MLLSPCRDSISGIVGSFLSVGAFSGWRALTIEHMGVVKVMNLQRTSEASLFQVSRANSKQKSKYR